MRSCGSQPPESLDDSREHLHEPLDVGRGRRPADRDPQRTVGVDAHRREHRRRFERLRRARRARVHGDAVLVEREQDRLGLDAGDPEAQQVGERAVAVALDVRARRRRRTPRRSISARSAYVSRSRSTSAHAAPKPTHAGTFSRPPRRARSCAPPTMNGGTRSPRRTSSAPAPAGPPNLCAVTEQRSASSARKSTGAYPAAAHASTCTSTFESRVRARRSRRRAARSRLRGSRAGR